MKRSRKGFTLAEVLITLSIIGVVAALTIPTVTRKFEKQQNISQFKETASILSQASKLIIANEGSLSSLWNAFPDTFYDKYQPYLKTTKQCYNMAAQGNCFASSYKTLDNNAYTIGSCGGSCYSVILANGVSVLFDSISTSGSVNDRFIFYIDTNGLRGPNVLGKDTHRLYILYNSGDPRPSRGLSTPPTEALLDQECPADLMTGCGGTCGDACGYRIFRGDYATSY